MVTIKTKAEIETLAEGGRHLAAVIEAVVKEAKPGVSSASLDRLANKLIGEMGDQPSFLGYKSRRDKRPFPAAICVSVNDEVVHSPPSAQKILQSGDLTGIDIGLIHDGLFLDSAVTIAVGGKTDQLSEKLLRVTKEALIVGIKAARPGNTTGDIGFAIEQFVKPYKYGIVRELAGHGVGYAVHEDPFIPNYGKKGDGPVLKPGMVIAIEPMFNAGGDAILLDKDGFTYRTADGKRSAHFEHTVLITDGEAEILTKI
jgi:methionyl aminopeptidase